VRAGVNQIRGASGTGSRFGRPAANIEAFTETQWLAIQGPITPSSDAGV
jgi:hypothetical protein